MNQIRHGLPLLLALCLLAALWGCDRGPAPSAEAERTAVTTEAPAPELPASDRQLLLDDAPAFPLCEAEGALYLRLRDLPGQAPVLTETPAGQLSLAWEGHRLLLRAGEPEAELSDGSRRTLSAPVLRSRTDWYLPLEGLELLGRGLVYDPAQSAYRCLRLEEGPALLCNGEALGSSLLWGGVPVLEASLLAERSEGSLELRGESLCLTLGGRVLLLRAGSPEAELDGKALSLPVPAWQAETRWYLPSDAAEALGCVLLQGEDRVELWVPTQGPELWFDGSALGPTRSFNGTPCAGLSALARAAGAKLEPQQETLRLKLGKRSLLLRPGSALLETEADTVTLPLPLLPQGEDWLAAVEPLAEALGLPRKDAEALVYSRMEPRETLLWVDGRECAACGLPEGPLYFDLETLMGPAQALPAEAGGCLYLQAFGRTLGLRPGASGLEVDGKEARLSAPVYAEAEHWYAPVELLSLLGLSELEDPELDQRYYTHIVKNDSLQEGYRVPILMYHAVSDHVWGIPELFVSPSRLEQQLQAIVEGGYTAITFEDLDRIDQIEKPVMLTFDDGYDDNYSELFPLLKQYNLKATVFIIVDDLGKSHKLTEEQVKEMSDSGLVSIQSHTMSHNYLNQMYEARLIHEHYDSMVALARITGKQPFVMCYPTGKNSYYSRGFTAKYYQYGLCMTGPCYVTGEDPYLIYRYYVPRNTGMETFRSYLEG